MKLGIMQPYFFPYLSYWQLINAVDKYVVYDDVNYIKGGWINRNYILINGNASLITLPLKHSSSFKNINEIDIFDNIKIKNKLLKSIELAYRRAPNFDNIMPILNDLILNNSNIAMLNYCSIKEICKYLNINTEIILSSKINKNNALKAQNKVINICKILKADSYINAINGKTLYSNEEFEKNNIKLNFLQMKNIKYKQYKNDFVPNLSIIDLMMFNSKEELNKLLNEFEIL